MLIDSHCHLDHADFAHDLDAVLKRARAAGVSTLLNIATTVAAFPRVLEIVEQQPDVFCTVGVHPHEAAAEAGVTAEDLIRLSQHPKVVGIGECGLDFYYNRSPQDVQRSVFLTHIAAARTTGLPLIVHSREADKEMASILTTEQQGGRFQGVLHCFSSGPPLAQAAIEVGFYISFSGILTFKKSEDLRGIARSLPSERLLVETDAPYLAPAPMRGRRNEPAFVGHTLAALAACREEAAPVLAERTATNFFQLFRKAAAAKQAN